MRPFSALRRYLSGEPEAKPRKFVYKYQRYPFDDWIEFSVTARNQAEADNKAREHFAELAGRNLTTMTKFYPA